MNPDRPYYPKEIINPKLWHIYSLTDDFKKHNMRFGINSVHLLIKQGEAQGLKRIITLFIGTLTKERNLSSVYAERNVDDWISEWCNMHKMLFQNIFKPYLIGSIRTIDVRFGDVGDEELHKIPSRFEVKRELQILAREISDEIKYVDRQDLDSICKFLASVHYRFIRIHPFEDGNGRIARALTDQLGISIGLPPIIAGFPRTASEKKKLYHAAITASATEPDYHTLKTWIRSQVEKRIQEIA